MSKRWIADVIAITSLAGVTIWLCAHDHWWAGSILSVAIWWLSHSLEEFHREQKPTFPSPPPRSGGVT
jgi:hypothetical protein